MPTHKIEILGSIIEINYEEREYDRLIRIIEKFNKRLNEYSNNFGKVSNNKILFLTALKTEAELEDKIDLLNKNTIYSKDMLKKNEIIENLNKEIILLKDKINNLYSNNSSTESSELEALEEIQNVKTMLDNLQKKILSNNDN